MSTAALSANVILKCLCSALQCIISTRHWYKSSTTHAVLSCIVPLRSCQSFEYDCNMLSLPRCDEKENKYTFRLSYNLYKYDKSKGLEL